MGTIKNRALRDAFHIIQTNRNVINYGQSQIKREKSRLDDFIPSDGKGHYSNKYDICVGFLDDSMQSYDDLSVVGIVAIFEKIVFEKYRNTFGSLRALVNQHATPPFDYYFCRESLIKDDIDKLAGIYKIIQGYLKNDLKEKFEGIKNYRDYIAHGKRFGQNNELAMGVEEIAIILDDVLSIIETHK